MGEHGVKTCCSSDPSTGTATHGETSPVLVDGHVHLHRCFDTGAFLDAASQNFQAAASEHDLPDNTPGCLMFTESAADNAFASLQAQVGQVAGQWRVHATTETCSLRLTQANRAPLYVVAGRQIVTRERLEVLALGTNNTFVEGLPIQQTIEAAQEAGAIAVLPWGFGKWSGQRGRIVADLIASDRWRQSVFLGDNGGRLNWGAEPKLFAEAAAAGMQVLPGSDPLPFVRETAKAGRYGFVLNANLEADQPAGGIAEALRQLETQPTRFGRLEGLAGFCRSQIGMQLRNRFNRGKGAG